MVLTLLPVSAMADDGAEADKSAPAEVPAAETEYVAQIGEAKYETLQAAIDAVNNNETIELLTDVDNAAGMRIDTKKTFTVDFKNHTYTVNKPGAGSKNTETNAFQLIKDQNITFKNGTIRLAEDNLIPTLVPNSSNYSNIRRIIQDYAELTLENMTIDSTNMYGYDLPMSFNNQPVYITGNTSVILKDGMRAAFDADGNWGSPTYQRCKVTLDTTGTINGNIELGSGYLDIKNVNAKGIRFCTSCGAAETTDQSKRISISGGTFSDLSALDYLASGASVTVKLAANTTKDVTIPAGATVTLDLNGHKIVNSATAQDKNVAEDSRKHTITNNGTLTILDSVGGGVVDNVSHGRAALYNAGTIVEIKGGKFTRSVDNSTDATSANGNSWYVIYNAEGANITKISSGEFLALGHFSSLFCNSGTINEISGGTFTQDGFIAFKNEGTVNKISGGTFSSESESCIQNWGTIGEISDGTITAGRIGIWNFSSDTYKSAGTISRITGGNISGTTAAIRLNDYDTDYKDSDKNVKGPSTVNKANASISAGNFSGALEVNAHTVLTITGGTYSVDPSAYVVPGYVASYNGSTYTVYYPVPVTPGNTSSSTTKNPDGSTTTTTTDKTTGTVTETTKNPDGSTTTVETRKDGSVTETNKTAGGSVGTVKSDANGNTEISASISAADVNAAAKKNEPVAAPVSVAPAASPAAAPVIKLSVPASAGEVSVVIPVTNAQQGTVAIKVNPDGTEEIIKTSVVTKDGVVLGVKGSAQIKIVNNDKDFSDTVGHWAESDVDFVSARELFTGTAPQTFSPETATTRGMVVTVLARLAGESTDGGANWYDKGCAWAVTNGVSDGTDPNGTVTREQLAAMLYRYFGSPAVSGSLSFADASSVSEYAHDAMQWCVNNGIINGMDGLLNPQGQATRAQVSAMFARYIRLMSTK